VRAALAIAARELRADLQGAAAWLGAALFLALAAFFGLSDGFFERGEADLRDFFSFLRFALLLLAPALAMRPWAEEHRAGTIELLFSFPIRPWQAVLGKFLAALGLLSGVLLISCAVPLSIAHYGALDPWQIAGGYASALALGALFLSAGLFASALSESQVVAFVLALPLCLAFLLFGEPALLGWLEARAPRLLVEICASLGAGPRLQNLDRGVLELRDLAYFTAVTLFFLWLNTLAVEERR